MGGGRRDGVAHVDVDFVEELHCVAHEHDRYNAPVDFPPEGFEVDILSCGSVGFGLRVLNVLES